MYWHAERFGIEPSIGNLKNLRREKVNRLGMFSISVFIDGKKYT